MAEEKKNISSKEAFVALKDNGVEEAKKVGLRFQILGKGLAEAFKEAFGTKKEEK